MILARFLTVFLSIYCFAYGVSIGQETTREVILTEDSDYYGFDLRSEKDISLDECKSLCLNNDQCRAFTYNTKVNWCFLKSDFDKLVTFQGAVAGKLVEISSEPDLGAPPRLHLIPSGMQGELLNSMNQISKLDLNQNAGSALALVKSGQQQLFANDHRRALGNFKSALKIAENNLAIWLQVSETIHQWLDGGKQNYQISRLALTSSVGFYRRTRTRTLRAAALASVAKSLAHLRQYQSAIGIYKQSLALMPTQPVKAALAKLRSENGFRIVGNTVEADTSAPKACIDFSFNLANSNVNYEDFVSVRETNDYAVTTTQRRLCVTNLSHGRSYSITLRSGLPSNFGEVLEFPATINTYIRDRAPTVRFNNSKFIIADAARQAIPVVGINTDKAKIELYRIGDRALSSLLSGSEFLTQLSDYQISRLGDDLGQQIWKGTLDLVMQRNQEAVTAFPIAQALPKRQPGVYVLTAVASGSKANDWEAKATQWFVISDIGLVTYAGNDGFTVFTNSLDNGSPLVGTELKLLARNNEILGTATTDKDGKANFPPGLMRGTAGLTPILLTADRPGDATNDFIFMDLNRAGFDLSDRGVEGRTSPGPLDTYTYLDRGIYRPGETVNAVSLVRNADAGAEPSIPVTAILWRPDNVEAKRLTSARSSQGGHVLPFNLPENAMRGTWRLAVHSDPQAEPLSEKKFLVEDFQPDRIEFDLTTQSSVLEKNNGAQIRVKGDYLYGAPARNLTIEGEIRYKSATILATAPGYHFGLTDEESDGVKLSPLRGLPTTNHSGSAEFAVTIDQELDPNKPAIADIVVRLLESGGRPVERVLTLPVKTEKTMIGIRPGFKDKQVAEGSIANFNVIAIDPSGNRTELKNVQWSLHRLNRNYQWYRSGGGWHYEAVIIPQLVQQGSSPIPKDGIAEISANVGWGRYRLEVSSRDPDGPASSFQFDAGWYVDATTTETPDALEIALDKKTYSAGDVARLKVSPKFAGELLIAIGTDSIHKAMRVSLPQEGSVIDIPVAADWGAGTYLTATLIRPGNLSAKRMPSRAIGTTWMAIDPGNRELAVKLKVPEKIRPNSKLTIPIEVTGNQPGEKAFATIAMVDVGILNLTNYTPPSPSKWYFAQRALGLEMRDVYGNLIDSSAGAIGRVRSGGDGPGLTAQGSPPTQKLLALFNGPVELDEHGKAIVAFDVPQFNGTARIMAVAWTRKSVGQTDSEIIIRDPVTVSASIPKVLAPQDKAISVLELYNADLEAAEFQLTAATDQIASLSGLPQQISLKKGETKTLTFDITAISPGTGNLEFILEQDGQMVSHIQQAVKIRPADLPVVTTHEFALASNGSSVTIGQNLLEESFLDNATISVNVSRHRALDISSLLMRLDQYPYGCAEQTTSRALPLLYLSDLGKAGNGLVNKDVRHRIQSAIDRILTFQSSSGGFGLWAPGAGDMWLDAYITDFLTRAREKQYVVPAQAMRLAVQNLQNQLGYQTNISEFGDAIAYATYVLARNKMASASDLRYFADTQINLFDSPLARAHLAAALGLYNETERMTRVFSSAIRQAGNPQKIDWIDANYGSVLRNNAAILALATEAKATADSTDEMLRLVAQEFEKRTHTSTQENAWLLLAARAVQEADNSIQLEVNGSDIQGSYSQRYTAADLSRGPITLRSRSGKPLVAVVTTSASPKISLPAQENGFSLQRKYYQMDGTETDLNNVQQNDRFVVVLSITQFNNSLSRILVSDLLPGGFEIDNPNLMSSAGLANFKWLGQTNTAHTEFRDDRFVAALNRSNGDPRSFSLAYVVRAVSPGSFAHPAATVEDMYRPEWQARTAGGFLKISSKSP